MVRTHLLAMKAGLNAKVADELAFGKRPSAMSDDEAAVYEFCIQLHRTRNVDDATFNRALALLGVEGGECLANPFRDLAVNALTRICIGGLNPRLLNSPH